MTEKKIDKKDVSAAVDDEHQKRWYVVNTYSGHENRVKENLEKRVESMGIQDSLFRIVVAEEPEIEIKNGKQVEKMHNMFPGYVFVEMKMTDEAWYVVRNTPGVTGFIGSSGGGAKPFPVAPDEMESILRRMGKSDKKVDVDFAVGDRVRILTGPFSGMEGKVSSMNDQTQVANVLTMLFGRETPTDINYTDLQKIDD
ncbi:MAG: transcription termination/antitermination protein NusG [Lactimicrobium sp.]|jgi:transcriptional antiterminator NusG|uniref:transcription termination/antitermination protein NusG n=1 Tax=Lactimicrobium sp. TaxID=2563780 RepID=UPI002F3595F3